MQVPLISNNEIKEIFELSAQAVYRLGSDELPVILSQICEYISVYDTMMVYAFVKDEGPQPLFNNFKIKEINNCWVPYFEGAYLLDPFYELSKQKVDDGFYHLRDIAPDDFFESDSRDHGITLSGLNPDSIYDLGFFAAKWAGTGSTNITRYTIISGAETSTVDLVTGYDGHHNTADMANAQNIKPMYIIIY